MRHLVIELKLILDLEHETVDPLQLIGMTTEQLVNAVVTDARDVMLVDDDAVKLELVAGYEQR